MMFQYLYRTVKISTYYSLNISIISKISLLSVAVNSCLRPQPKVKTAMFSVSIDSHINAVTSCVCFSSHPSSFSSTVLWRFIQFGACFYLLLDHIPRMRRKKIFYLSIHQLIEMLDCFKVDLSQITLECALGYMSVCEHVLCIFLIQIPRNAIAWSSDKFNFLSCQMVFQSDCVIYMYASHS